MMNFDLPNKNELPDGFEYPENFLKVIRLEIVDLEPWIMINNRQVCLRIKGLRERYPNRILIPFARRLDNDDIACFELFKGERVQIIHDFATSGFEQRKEYLQFWDWFKQAVDDMIQFE